MSDYEHAYLLDEFQLFQLLSCIDERPVIGLASRAFADAPEDVRKQVAFSLIQNGWLVPATGGFVLPAERAAPLLTMKNAPRVLLILFRGEDAPVRVLYIGSPLTVVELCGNAYYRLYELPSADVLEWFEEAGAFPKHPIQEADTPLLLRTMPTLRMRLEKLETEAPPIDTPPLEWAKREDVRLLTDMYDSRKGTICRWVWADFPESGVVLQQRRNGCSAALDTAERRAAIVQTYFSGQIVPFDGLPLPSEEETEDVFP